MIDAPDEIFAGWILDETGDARTHWHTEPSESIRNHERYVRANSDEGQLQETCRAVQKRDAAEHAISIEQREIDRLRSALEFYADPDTWFATLIISDPPCGDIVNDYSDIEIEGCARPGTRARKALGGWGDD